MENSTLIVDTLFIAHVLMKCHIARLSANSIVKITLSFTMSTSHLSSQTGMSSMYTLFFWANIAFGSVCNCNTAQLHFPNVILTVWCVTVQRIGLTVSSPCAVILWDYCDSVHCEIILTLCSVHCALCTVSLWHCDGSINPTVIIWHSLYHCCSSCML